MARNAFDACLMISAELMSVTRMASWATLPARSKRGWNCNFAGPVEERLEYLRQKPDGPFSTNPDDYSVRVEEIMYSTTRSEKLGIHCHVTRGC